MPGGSSKAKKGKGDDPPTPAGVTQRGVWSVERNDRDGLNYDDVEKSIKAVSASGEFNHNDRIDITNDITNYKLQA